MICLNCPHKELNEDGSVNCLRRSNEDVVVLINKDKINIECHARDAEVWDEEMIEDDDGELIFKGLVDERDTEIDMEYIKENTYGLNEV